MTATVSRARRLLPSWERPTQRAALGLAIGALVLGTVLSIIDHNTQVKVAGVIVIVVVLSSLVLDMRGMLAELAVVAGCLITVFSVHGLHTSQLSVSGFVMISVTGWSACCRRGAATPSGCARSAPRA